MGQNNVIRSECNGMGDGAPIPKEYFKTILVDNDEADFISKALQDWHLMDEDDVITHTAVFPNGMEIDVKCVGCQDQYEENDNHEIGGNEPSWTEAVLFDHGCEVNCTEPGEEYFGDWFLEDRNGNRYCVRVAEKDGSITKDRIKNGIKQNIIRFDHEPDCLQGTACWIGDYWFWFGGLTAEEENPEEFLRDVPIDDIVDEIYITLEDFRKQRETKAEYGYYDAVLSENGI